jgi:nitroreductase
MQPHELAKVIRDRRSSLLIDPTREVPREIVAELCELLTWAPNHKRTWPWKIAVLSGDTRRVLGERISTVMAAQGDDEPKVLKTRTKYLRSPNVIAVGALPGDSAERTAENRYAVAAGVQNLLLAAHAHGLAALWGSPARGTNGVINEICGFPEQTEIMGLLYLGWPNGTVESPGRPTADITWL